MYLQRILPHDWKEKLYAKVNSYIFELIKYDAPSTVSSWSGKVIQHRPVRTILPHFFSDWREQYSETSAKYIEAWISMPLKFTERGGATDAQNRLCAKGFCKLIIRSKAQWICPVESGKFKQIAMIFFYNEHNEIGNHF